MSSNTPHEIAATWPVIGLAFDHLFLDQIFARLRQRDPGAGDRRRARAAVGLDHVAIERDGAIAQRFHVDDRAQRAADQALDFLRAARLLALRGFAAAARVRGARQHAVFARHPALALPLEPARHALLDARGAQHMRLPELAPGTSLRRSARRRFRA